MVDRELNLNHLGGSYGGGINPFFVLDLQQRVDDTRPLEKDFVPTSWSVICGRTKKSEDHAGNKRLNILCELACERYWKATVRQTKTMIVSEIVDAIQTGNEGPGAFVKWNEKEKRWYEVSDSIARDKVGQCLRKLLRKQNLLDSSPSNSAMLNVEEEEDPRVGCNEAEESPANQVFITSRSPVGTSESSYSPELSKGIPSFYGRMFHPVASSSLTSQLSTPTLDPPSTGRKKKRRKTC